jgi:hypothetical protein
MVRLPHLTSSSRAQEVAERVNTVARIHEFSLAYDLLPTFLFLKGNLENVCR